VFISLISKVEFMPPRQGGLNLSNPEDFADITLQRMTPFGGIAYAWRR
jgi:hypothetical protein